MYYVLHGSVARRLTLNLQALYVMFIEDRRCEAVYLCWRQ